MLKITINLDKKCIRCNKEGALLSGLCADCVAKAFKKGEFNQVIEKAKKGGKGW